MSQIGAPRGLIGLPLDGPRLEEMVFGAMTAIGMRVSKAGRRSMAKPESGLQAS